jgi:hypothetical protein
LAENGFSILDDDLCRIGLSLSLPAFAVNFRTLWFAVQREEYGLIQRGVRAILNPGSEPGPVAGPRQCLPDPPASKGKIRRRVSLPLCPFAREMRSST